MTEARFLCKTDKYGITTTLLVVVMLLLFMISCGKENKEVVDVVFDPENTYTIRTTNVASLISDSGITRYRMNAKEWLMFEKAKEPYSYFPQGVYVEKFDSLFTIEASVKADTAYFWDKKGLYKLIGNVHVLSLEGKKLDTSVLFIDQKEDRIYTDEYFELQEGEKVVTGFGFESNQSMTKYTFFTVEGTFPVSETPRDMSHANIVPGDSTEVSVAK